MYALMLENESGNIVNINDGISYVVTAVSGLNPPSASLFTSKSPNRKGSKYNGSTLDERNVVIEIKILGDIEKNRNALYNWVDTEQYCKIRYQNGVKNVYCEGYVQDCSIDLFTDNEVVSVAVVCPNPYWKELNEIIASISKLIKQFTFPFAISAAGIPLSTMNENYSTNVFNTGAETGLKITIKCTADVTNLTIFDDKDTTRRFALKTTIHPNEVVVIDTEASPKTCKRYKADGGEENLLKYIVPVPTWFTLKKGNNVFGYTADEGVSAAEITIGYTNKYLGV